MERIAPKHQCSASVWGRRNALRLSALPEGAAQFRQHHLAVELDKPLLIRSGSVEHQVAEAELYVRTDLLDVFIGIGGDDPAAGGALDRQGIGEAFHFAGILDR